LQLHVGRAFRCFDSDGSTQLSASAVDHLAHHIASWVWSDDDAGGSFSPSATAQNPTYTAPVNATADDQVISLTVVAACNSSPAASGGATIEIVVTRDQMPVYIARAFELPL